VLTPVALADRDDQLLADVAREVEVDVGHRGELAVEEAADREAGEHRIDVREAGQVADDRADGASAAPAGREDVARDRAAAHLERALSRQLEHLPVEEEEPCEAELADQLQFFVESFACSPLVPVGAAVALPEGAIADAGELPDRRLAALGEIGIAVAQVLGQVELQARSELAGALDGAAVEREALRQLLRRGENALAVAAALRLTAVERGAAADRHEHVLEVSSPRVVRMRIAGRDGADTEGFREIP